MRGVFAALIVFGLSAAADAQTVGLPLPAIGLPLPEIGLPLPPTGLAPLHSNSVRSVETPHAGRPPATHGRGGRATVGVVYVVPAYGWEGTGAPVPGPPSVPVVPPPTAPTGRLDLDVQPGVDAQVFLDGYFVGMLSDTGSVLALAPGPHRVELHADGFEPIILDVDAVADRSIIYRASLKPLPSPSPAAASPADAPPVPARSTIYMIPGCYVGNLPPRDVALPAGCDPTRAAVLRP